ncbi:ACT domain-containing protein [Ursidibacter sp. B-7004-1]
MTKAISDLTQLIHSMEPVLHSGIYYFVSVDNEFVISMNEIISMIKEQEGTSLIVDEQTLAKYQLHSDFKTAWITLNVHSDLSAVGLTAAFSTALGNAGISCNVVAGNYHDHIFVPYDKAELAMQTLWELQQSKG